MLIQLTGRVRKLSGAVGWVYGLQKCSIRRVATIAALGDERRWPRLRLGMSSLAVITCQSSVTTLVMDYSSNSCCAPASGLSASSSLICRRRGIETVASGMVWALASFPFHLLCNRLVWPKV